MKPYKIIFTAALTLLAACSEDTVYEPGPADSPDCMGVYFDADNARDFIFIPGEDAKVTIKMHRQKTASAVDIPLIGASTEEGVTFPATAHFDSFALDRLITIPEIRPMWDALEGVPAQFVFILANTSTYGGSGPYNEYAIGSAGNPWWGEIIVHEFGHTFANLGDEYEEGYDLSYTPDFEPEEPNITTLYQKPCKWQHLIDAGKATLIEGAGYQATGVWRGAENCLMRAVGDKLFCPVCTDAIQSTIRFYTEDL